MTIFDDEYTGPRFTYGCAYRPAIGANIPRGSILFSGRPHPGYAHGTIDYPEALDAATAERFDLTDLSAPAPTYEACEVCGQEHAPLAYCE